jgi:tetratricopeptide (TPR) repeat protein
VAAGLAALRKPATKLGRQVDLEIDLAVTRALLGEPREAIRSLDQIARVQPHSEIAARARYEIGEIHRRLGRFEKARSEYEESLKERRGTPYSDLAQRKSTAIAARSQAMERLRDAPRVLDAWSKMRAANTDSLGAQLELQAKFEDLATQQLRVAEIDLLELGQPLVSLDEFQAVLTRFPGSMQSARAAFGIAYVYDHELHDAERARAAYAAVARDYPDTPQGRDAQAKLEQSGESGSEGEVQQPSLPR